MLLSSQKDSHAELYYYIILIQAALQPLKERVIVRRYYQPPRAAPQTPRRQMRATPHTAPNLVLNIGIGGSPQTPTRLNHVCSLQFAVARGSLFLAAGAQPQSL